MTYDPRHDIRLDPRAVPVLAAIANTIPPTGDVDSRDQILAEAITPEALAREAQMESILDALDDEALVPRAGLRSEVHEITSQPDGNTIKLQMIRPDTAEILPCIYYIHGGGMMVLSCFRGNYQAWARCIAHQGVCVVMVDFRNCVRPSSAPEIAPYPAGLNDCVSGFHWVHEHAEKLLINKNQLLVAGESGGGNLAIATTMKLVKEGYDDRVVGVYALCPYIAGQWPTPEHPSSTENDGIFIHVGDNRGAMAYGIEAFEAQDPLAWPSFATEEDVRGFPPTMINVNECDPLRDEGIAFFRLLMKAGVKAHCRQVMGTFHASDMFMPSVFLDHNRMTARDIASWLKECCIP